MDKEAQDAIIYWMKNPIMGKVAIDYVETTEQILINLENLGYRKPPEGEPPLLSREDINGNPLLLPAYIKHLKKYSYTMANRATQRDSDIKWMRGE